MTDSAQYLGVDV